MKACDLVTSALAELNYKRMDEAAQEKLLPKINDMLIAEALLGNIVKEATLSIDLTALKQSYVFGTDIANTAKPRTIYDVQLRDTGGYDYVVDVIPKEQYLQIPKKDYTANIVTKAYYEYSSGTISLFPVISSSGYSLSCKLGYAWNFSSFRSDDLEIDAQYHEYLVLRLALNIVSQLPIVASGILQGRLLRALRLINPARAWNVDMTSVM